MLLPTIALSGFARLLPVAGHLVPDDVRPVLRALSASESVGRGDVDAAIWTGQAGQLLHDPRTAGDPEALNVAVSYLRRAVSATPTDHPEHAARLSDFANALRLRFEHVGDVADLDQAVELGQRAVATTAADHPDRAGRLSNLAVAWQTRFGWSGDVGDLHRADDSCAQYGIVRSMVDVVRGLRAGLYGRESKEKTKSVDDQLEDGRSAIEDRDWTLVDLYTDGVSASRFGRKIRKGWKRLLTDLDAGLIDVIVTWEPSRADRDLTTWVQFVAKCRDTGVLVFIVGGDELLGPRVLSHWKRLIDGGVDAAMESEKTSKRTRRGVAKAAAAGGFHGDCPYGYERVIVGERQTSSGPKPVKAQRRHPEHAPIVAEIFDRISRNESIHAVVADLNARGVVAPAGTAWHRNTVRKMVLNVAYIGKRAHYGEVYDGTWEGLVSPEVFHAAGEIVRDPRRRKGSSPGKLKHLLSYLATGQCGGLVHFQPAQPGRNNHGRYHCFADGCVTATQVEVDEVIARLMVKRVCRPDIRDLFTDDDEPAQKARDELAALKAKLTEATESFLEPTGGISADRLAEIEHQLKPMIEDAQRRAVSRRAPMAMLALLDAAEFGEQKVRPEWDRLAVPAKREVLRLLFTKVQIVKSDRVLSRWSSDAERLAAAVARTKVTWRKPGQPAMIPRQPGPRPGSGGARAQRRAKTSIELLAGHAVAVSGTAARQGRH